MLCLQFNIFTRLSISKKANSSLSDFAGEGRVKSTFGCIFTSTHGTKNETCCSSLCRIASISSSLRLTTVSSDFMSAIWFSNWQNFSFVTIAESLLEGQLPDSIIDRDGRAVVRCSVSFTPSSWESVWCPALFILLRQEEYVSAKKKIYIYN